MDVNDLINLNSLDQEKEITKAIIETEEQLSGLTKEQTCLIYSSYLNNNLKKHHIISRIINTKDLDCSYEHQFNLVPIDNKNYYLLDLNYEQFHNDDFPKLNENGYMKVNDISFQLYLTIVGKDTKNITLEEAFYETERKIK